MDYKKTLIIYILLSGIFIFFGCTEKQKSNKENTYYIELTNFKADSLQQSIQNSLFGKVSFRKANKIEILSINYLTDNMVEEMHYFNNLEILKGNTKEGSRKIKIELAAPFTYDSVKYSLQKYIYRNKQWVKTSDMGVLKIIYQLVQPKNKIAELA